MSKNIYKNLYIKKYYFGSTFSQKVVFAVLFLKVLFWSNLFLKGCFCCTFFKSTVLVQPFPKRLFLLYFLKKYCFGSTFSQKVASQTPHHHPFQTLPDQHLHPYNQYASLRLLSLPHLGLQQEGQTDTSLYSYQKYLCS
jgi:hypothetical protein